MDCSDIVIIGARGFTHRIRDYYTRDRSSPQEDSMYGGEYSLTGAVAREKDGITKAIFRRRLTSSDPADHSIEDKVMTVIWAIGQTFEDYYHRPGSSLEAGEASNTNFYQPDEIKYHGSRHRGQTSINFFSRDQPTNTDGCSGSYMDPSCRSPDNCVYRAEWFAFGGNLRVRVVAKVDTNRWAAIGFSRDTLMPASDIVLGAADEMRSFIHDRFATARAQPPIDRTQNLVNASASRVDGFTVLDFTRPLDTGDSTQDVSLTQCVYFMFGYNGPVVSFNGVVGYHPNTPLVSPTTICLSSQCTGEPTFNLTVLSRPGVRVDNLPDAAKKAELSAQANAAALQAAKQELFILYIVVGILSALVLFLVVVIIIIGVCCARNRTVTYTLKKTLSDEDITPSDQDIKEHRA
jgi:hypothetical protein